MSPMVEQLREELQQKEQLIADLDAQLKAQQARMEQLQHQMNQLLRRLYGRSSEKLDPNQLLMEEMILDADGEAQAPEPPPPPEAETNQTKRRRRSTARTPLPSHLPRHEIILSVPEDEKTCPVTGQPRPFLRYEECEKLEYIPETLRVNVYKREIYGSPTGAEENGVVTAPTKPAVIERCLADTGLLAQVAVAKFDDHLPLYRQERAFLRQGVELSRKTMAGWLSRLGEGLRPLWERLAERILGSGIVHHDDTPVKMLDPGAGKTKETRLWVAMSGAGPPLVHLTFSPNRRQQTPIEFFRGYSGVLMCDEYAGYDNVDCGDLLSCWAHARRYVEKAQVVEPAFATTVLLEIAKLYRLEKQIRTLPDSERQHIRESQSREQVESIFQLLEQKEFRPQSPMQKAKNYILNHRHQLEAYTQDARYPIDNNPVERALRRVSIGRKNWLFLGSETGGQTAAVLMSLLATCWAHRVNAWAYLRDVLERLPTQAVDDLDDLLPDRWIDANPAARLPDQKWAGD